VTERGSTQHGRRLDDEMASEVEALVRSGRESRADDGRMHEPPADDEPLADARLTGTEHAADGVLDLDEVEARSLLAASLRPSVFPADRESLLAVADEQHAPDNVIAALASLPDGIRFVTVQQVWEALGGERERRDTPAPEPQAPQRPPAAPTATVSEPVAAAIQPEPEPEPEPTPVAAPSVAAAERSSGGPWWASAARTGAGLALLPLRIGVRVAQGLRERVEDVVRR
jgi:uncharacterized protein DUF2795